MNVMQPQPSLIVCEILMPDGPTEMDPGSVGLTLRAARKRAGLSNHDAATLAGISKPLLNLIERGEHPLTNVSSRNLARLNLAFGLSWPEFVSIILPVYGAQLPYLHAARSVSSRNLYAPGSIKCGLSPSCQTDAVRRTISVPDYAAISSYPDADLMVLHVTPDSLACDQARATVPVDSHAIFNTRLMPREGDVVAVWLDAEDRGALQIWEQDGRPVILNSYDDTQRPVVTERPSVIRGVYVGHLSSGRRGLPDGRTQH